MPVDYRTPASYKPPKPPALPPRAPLTPAAANPGALQYWQAVQANQQQLAPVGAGYPTPNLTPEDVNYFDTARRRADQAYGHGIAQDQYSQGGELQAHNLALQAMNQRFDELRNRLPGSFIRRGVGQSGIAATGFQNFNRDRLQSVFGENQRFQQGVGQHRITQNQLAEVWDQTAKDLAAQREARRQTILAAYNNGVR